MMRLAIILIFAFFASSAHAQLKLGDSMQQASPLFAMLGFLFLAFIAALYYFLAKLIQKEEDEKREDP